MKKISIFTAVILTVGLSGAQPAFAVDWGSALGSLGVNKKTTLGSTKIGEGLKEALRVGIDKTVQATGRRDGYYANEAIKILMPEKLRSMEALLRKVGFGPKIDEFVLSMNRAAEAAAPHAKEIFIDAIADMSLEDAEGLLKGGDTAATEYFKKKTGAKLAAAYRPVVTEAMSKNSVAGRYQAVVGRYQALPMASRLPAPNIEEYTVQKSLDGLFYMLGQEEKKIRQDPAARVTTLLQDVFKG